MSFSRLRTLLNKPQQASAPTERHRVVIIDDDPAILESLTELLQDEYQVIPCASAREGVDAVDENVAAVILDVKMPGEDGFWACTEIHKKTPDIRVIFYSAYQDVKDPFEIINDHHPFGYVNKGYDIDQLLSALSLAVKFQGTIIASRRLLELQQQAETDER